MIELRPVFSFSSQIWLILLGFGPFCLDLAHFGWIKAILLGFGPYSLDFDPKGDKALRVGQGGADIRMYGRTDSPCVLQDFVPFGAAAQKQVTRDQIIAADGGGQGHPTPIHTPCPHTYTNTI